MNRIKLCRRFSSRFPVFSTLDLVTALVPSLLSHNHQHILIKIRNQEPASFQSQQAAVQTLFSPLLLRASSLSLCAYFSLHYPKFSILLKLYFNIFHSGFFAHSLSESRHPPFLLVLFLPETIRTALSLLSIV